MVSIPGFPAIGPIGNFEVQGSDGSLQTVEPDGGSVVTGFLLYSILAELRVMNVFMQRIANSPTDNLATMRADAVADMGTIYVANPSTPVASS